MLISNENNERRRNARNAAGRETLKRFKPGSRPKTFCFVARDKPRQAAIKEQSAERDDKWLDLDLCDQKSIYQAQKSRDADDRENRDRRRQDAIRQERSRAERRAMQRPNRPKDQCRR